MFGRSRRKARAARETAVAVEAASIIEDTDASAIEAMSAGMAADTSESALAFTRTQVSLDETFLALMAQLDDSLAAMARACDRIEDAVAGASRQYPYTNDVSAA